MSTSSLPAPTSAPAAPAPRRRRRWLRAALIAAVLLVGAPLAVYEYTAITTRIAWEQAEAEAALDLPRWKLHELEADRRQVPDEENSALRIIAILKKGSGGAFGNEVQHGRLFDKLPSNVSLNEQQRTYLRDELAKVPALEACRQLKDCPYGRYPIKYGDHFIFTLVRNQQESRQIGRWLQNDVMLLAHEKQTDRAVDSCRALINNGRAIGDELFHMTAFIRVVMGDRAIMGLERVLAQGEASDSSLKDLQQLMELEIQEFDFLQAYRGKRAGVHHLFEQVKNGNMPQNWSQAKNAGLGSEVGAWMADTFPSTMLRHYPEYLQHQNQVVAVAKLPRHLRGPKLVELKKHEEMSSNPLFRHLPGATVPTVHGADCRCQAGLRSAVTAIACERFRLHQGKWPDTLDDLVTHKLLAAVPSDPLDDQPLRYRRKVDSIIIYSIGMDLIDNAGHMDPDDQFAPGNDVGFRLWNPNQRRLPPRPPIELEKP